MKPIIVTYSNESWWCVGVIKSYCNGKLVLFERGSCYRSISVGIQRQIVAVWNDEIKLIARPKK